MPILNLMVVAMVGLITFLWAARGKGRGVFSSFLAMVCVLVAGAVAFGVWEPLVYGVFMGMREDIAWTLGLLLPFGATLLVLRLIVDQTVRANMEFDDVTNFVGGAVFGLVSGVVTAGIVVIAASFLRFGPDMMGYKPIADDRGNLSFDKPLWVPVDRLTAGFYERLSLTTLSTATPLAERLPAVWEHAATGRRAFAMTEDNKPLLARTTIKPEQFAVKGRYRVESPRLGDLLKDSNLDKAQDVIYPDGSTPSDGAAIEGYAVQFLSGSAEKSGQVVIGSGQVRLLVRKSDGETVGLYPIAVVSQPEAGAGMYRFRVDSDGLFFPSVGGQSSPAFVFEFVVPPGAVATDLFVKGTRVELGGSLATIDAKNVFRTAKARDDAIVDQSLFERFGVAAGRKMQLDASESQRVTTTSSGGVGVQAIEVGANLPGQMVLNAGSMGQLEITTGKEILDGEHMYSAKDIQANRGIDRDLRVDKFAVTRDTGLVKIVLSDNGRHTLLGQAVSRAESVVPPMVVDDKGNAFECVGFIYQEGDTVRIRYTPGRPIRGMSEVPSLSASKRDQTLRLLFRPTKGARITAFALGNKQVAEFDPPAVVR